MDKINLNVPIGFAGFYFNICPSCNRIWRQISMKEKAENSSFDPEKGFWFKDISALCDQCWDVEYKRNKSI